MKLRSILTAATAIVLAVGMATVVQAVTSKITSNNNLRLYGVALNPEGYFTVDDDMVITGNARVKGSTEVQGELFNSKNGVTVNDDLKVTGLLSINTMPIPTDSSCATPGGLSYDQDYLYICAGGNWKRVALEDI